jgi:hypothetical protein
VRDDEPGFFMNGLTPAVAPATLGLRSPLCAASLLALLAGAAPALDVVSYYSPRNFERTARSRTDYILLHTTEAPKASALRKLQANGETHYFLDRAGRIYRIIQMNRTAYHAGTSMWNGRSDLDTCSVGIEMDGYHNQDISPAQYTALRELLTDLQRIYRIPDQRVLTHSMVAYGPPNKWFRSSHRGRKRCGMLFAVDSVRRKLGLDKRYLYDPDVRAGRLTVGDPYLAGVLYGRGGVLKASGTQTALSSVPRRRPGT